MLLTVMEGMIEVKFRQGRPRKEYLEDIITDMVCTSQTEMKKIAQIREIWRWLVNVAANPNCEIVTKEWEKEIDPYLSIKLNFSGKTPTFYSVTSFIDNVLVIPVQFFPEWKQFVLNVEASCVESVCNFSSEKNWNKKFPSDGVWGKFV